jgi:HNH endonuclease
VGRMAAKKRTRLPESSWKAIYAKTDGHCHFCGDPIRFEDRRSWVRDHVAQLQKGGPDTVENCLPACSRCNALRWMYAGNDLRDRFFLGLVAADEIKNGTPIGDQLRRLLIRRSVANAKRRRRLGANAETVGQQEADLLLNRVKRSTPKRKTIPIGAVQTTMGTM